MANAFIPAAQWREDAAAFQREADGYPAGIYSARARRAAAALEQIAKLAEHEAKRPMWDDLYVGQPWEWDLQRTALIDDLLRGRFTVDARDYQTEAPKAAEVAK